MRLKKTAQKIDYIKMSENITNLLPKLVAVN